MKKFFQDFKAFAMRGNVVDMAVGVIIGAAFGKIVSSLVADIIMPVLGLIVGGIDFSDMAVTIKAAELDAAGAVVTPAVMLKYGAFVQVTFDFLIMAFAVFLMIKGISALQRKKEAEPAPEPAPAPEPKPTPEQELLTEIRDLLKKQAEK